MDSLKDFKNIKLMKYRFFFLLFVFNWIKVRYL